MVISSNEFENDFEFENEFQEQNQNESLKRIYEKYKKGLEQRNDSDYRLNLIQWRKLVSLVAFLQELASEFDEVPPIEIKPSHETGDVVADFVTLSVSGEDVGRFCKVLSYASAISFDVADDLIHVEIVIPKVFIKKTRE